MFQFHPGKRSHISSGGRFVAGLALVFVGVGAVLYREEMGWHAWLFFGVALGGLLTLMLWRAEDRQKLAEEELIEVARLAIKNEAERLDAKRAELETVLMAYGEWMEFPDFDELRNIEWATQGKSEQDAEVAKLLDQQADEVLRKFSAGDYFVDGQFQTRTVLLELFGFMENIAKVYRPDSERPILETNLEALFKAVNRASLQVILLLEELPLIDVKDLNLRKMADGVRKASKVYRKYEEIQPYLEPVRYLWQGSKLLLTSNPLLAAGWIAGTELIWRGGKHVGKKAIDAYLLSLVRQTLGILAWETASIFDRTHRYRNPDWVFAVELTHLVSLWPMDRDTLREALRELGKIPLRSSYDRIFLYRCLAQHVSPKPERFAQPDLLALETRGRIFDRLEAFFETHVEDATEKEIGAWKKGLAKRLSIEE